MFYEAQFFSDFGMSETHSAQIEKNTCLERTPWHQHPSENISNYKCCCFDYEKKTYSIPQNSDEFRIPIVESVSKLPPQTNRKTKRKFNLGGKRWTILAFSRF